jgi:hypothetical protein
MASLKCFNQCNKVSKTYILIVIECCNQFVICANIDTYDVIRVLDVMITGFKLFGKMFCIRNTDVFAVLRPVSTNYETTKYYIK